MAQNWWEEDPVVENTPTEGANSWLDEDELVEEPVVSSPPAENRPVIRAEDVRDETGVPGGVIKKDAVRMPDTAMYERIPPQASMEDAYREARKLYESYEGLPESGRTITGELTYKNTVVPMPETQLLGGTSDIGFGQVAQTTARGIVKNTAVTGAAMLDQLNKTIFGMDSNLAQAAEDMIANPTPAGNAADSLITQTGEMAAGMIAGLRGGQAVSGVSSRGKYVPGASTPPAEIGTIAKILSGVGSTLGGTMTMNEDSEGMVVGTLLQGVPVDENGHYSEQVLTKKLNLLYDQLAGAMVAQKGAQAAEAALMAIKGITIDQVVPMFSQGTREQDAIDNVVEALNMNTPEGIEKLQKLIKDNQSVWIKIADSNIDNFNLQRTTMSAVEEGLNDVDKWRARRAMDLEAGVFHSGNTSLQRKLDQPMENFREFQQQAIESRGGAPTIEAARQNIAQSGLSEVEQLRSMPRQQQEIVSQADEAGRELLRQDTIVGPDIRRMEGSPEINVGEFKSSAEDRVMADIRQTAETMGDVKDKLYDAIPEGTQVDVESLTPVMRNAEPYLSPALIEKLSDEGTVVDYKFLHNEVLPDISKKISRLEKANPNDPGIDALMDLRRNITDNQIEFISKNGSPEARKAAEAARRYYREDYAPFAKSSSTEKLFDRDPTITEYDKKDIAQAAVNSLSDKRKGGSQAIIDLLKRPENSGKSEDIVRVYMGDVVKKLSRKAASEEGIDSISSDDIIGELSDMGVTLKREFPNEARQLEVLASRLRTAKGNAKTERALLEEITSQSQELENQVFSSAIGKFIKRGKGDNIHEVENGYDVFKSMLNKENNHAEIDELVKRVRASGDEAAQKGLESAYLSYLRDRIQDGSQGFASRQAERFVDPKEVKSLKEYGMRIFKDPKIVEGVDDVVSALLRERDKRSPTGMPLQTKGSLGKAATAAVNFATSMTLGVLNPTATRVRNVAGALLRGSKGDQAAMRIMERIHSDPEYTLDLLDKLGKLKEKEKFTSTGKNLMWKIATYNYWYDQDQKADFEKDWNDYVKRGKMDSEMNRLKGARE